MRTRSRDIGVEIALWAKIHVRKSKKYSMDGNARAKPCTRKLAWFHSRTCMVGLRNLHGSARASAWLDVQDCMVQLPALHRWTKNRAGSVQPWFLVPRNLRNQACSCLVEALKLQQPETAGIVHARASPARTQRQSRQAGISQKPAGCIAF